MPNPKWEVYENKATGIEYDLTDADAQNQLTAIKDGTDIDSFGDVETALDGKVDAVSGKGLSTNDYTNSAKGIVDNIQSNVIANTKLIKDTVGWNGKNKLHNDATTQTIEDITYIVNADKSVSVSAGTASDKSVLWYHDYRSVSELNNGDKLSGCANANTDCRQAIVYFASDKTGISEQLQYNNEDVTISIPNNAVYYRTGVAVNSGKTVTAQTLYPMIRDADILDSTYEPYFGSTAFPRSEQEVLGAKNMCCITGIADKSSNTDVTWSANSVRIKSDVAAQYINTNLNIKSLPKNKTVKISFDATVTAGAGIAVVKGKATGGSYATLLNKPVNSSGAYSFEFNTGNNDEFQLNLYASTGTAVTGDITYNNIMISLDGGEYAPYAMTNKELTEKVKELDSYLEQSVTLSTSDVTTVTFTNAIIKTTSIIEYACSKWGIVPDDITVSNGSCVITIPKQSTAETVSIRIYVR